MSSQISPSNTSAPAAPTRSNQNPPAFMIPFMKMPLILYRLGLGWMLGKRFMRLTHVGRRSGKVYQSVLAVLRFDENTHEILAVSPWSASNWYRNIQATPALEVETGHRQRPLCPGPAHPVARRDRRAVHRVPPPAPDFQPDGCPHPRLEDQFYL